MKSREEIRRRCAELFLNYQEISSVEDSLTNFQSVEHEMDIALAKYETLSWVFEDEDMKWLEQGHRKLASDMSERESSDR